MQIKKLPLTLWIISVFLFIPTISANTVTKAKGKPVSHCSIKFPSISINDSLMLDTADIKNYLESADTACSRGKRGAFSIAQTVLKSLGPLQHKYDFVLREHPEVKGTVTARFTIAETGKVTSSAIVSSTINDKEFQAFMLGFLRIIRFDKLDFLSDTTVVEVPFDFSKRSEF